MYGSNTQERKRLQMDKEQEPQVQLKVRLPQDLRDHLSAAASARGTSLNREIVDRLENSRRGTAAQSEDVLGREAVAIIIIIASILRHVSDLCAALEPVARERGWMHSPYAFDQAARA
jgi:hypothetical protein